MTGVFGSFRLWLVAVFLVIVGTVLVSTHMSVSQQRITHLEAIVKCPTCADLSVAQSNAPSAIAVRRQIVASVRAGRSDTSILTTLETQYGTGILLSPQNGALRYILFVGPLVVVLSGLVIYMRLFRRR